MIDMPILPYFEDQGCIPPDMLRPRLHTPQARGPEEQLIIEYREGPQKYVQLRIAAGDCNELRPPTERSARNECFGSSQSAEQKVCRAPPATGKHALLLVLHAAGYVTQQVQDGSREHDQVFCTQQFCSRDV